jgi:hypothetical protein
MRFEWNDSRAGESDEFPDVPPFHGKERESMATGMSLHPIGQCIALVTRKYLGKKLHDSRIGVQFCERLTIGGLPAPQQESRCLDYGHISYASLMRRIGWLS